MKREGELWRFTGTAAAGGFTTWSSRIARIKRRTGPMLGFQGFWTARRTLAGVEVMVMLAKGQVRAVLANDMRLSGLSFTRSSVSPPDRRRVGRRSFTVS